jgi:L-alanine-DL-glutamate epimerase-like enolase superfamily enzyme
MEDQANLGGHSGYFVLVHVQTDSGNEGWGECATGSDYGEGAFAAKAIIDRGFSPRLLGKDPLEYRKLWHQLYASTENYGRRDLGILALSGVDTALVDIAAKSAGVPASVFLGGRYRTEIPLYASLLFDMDDPRGTAEKGKKYVTARYQGVKFGWGMVPSNPFGRDPKKDELMVKTLREELGKDIRLMIDVGRYVNLSPSQALKLAQDIAKYDVTWLEEPLPRDDTEGYEQLTSRSPIPVAAGEGFRGIQDFKRAIVRKEVDLLQPDVSKAGGLSECRLIVDFAHAFNTPWVPHNWSTAINAVATIHLVASAPDGYLMEFKREPNPLVQKLAKNAETVLSIHDGRIAVPGTPGLGIEIDEDVVSRYESAPG